MKVLDFTGARRLTLQLSPERFPLKLIRLHCLIDAVARQRIRLMSWKVGQHWQSAWSGSVVNRGKFLLMCATCKVYIQCWTRELDTAENMSPVDITYYNLAKVHATLR